MPKYELLTNNYSNINTNKYIILFIISIYPIYIHRLMLVLATIGR